MNRLLAFLSIILLMLIGVSCQSDNETTLSGDSGFKISLQEDVEIETRTVPNGLAQPVLTNFTLKIVNQSGHTVYDGKYTDRTIAASPGQYDLSAAYGDNPVVALDAPYYAGTTQASVSLGQTTPVTISCGVANALTSVVFKSDPTGGDFDTDFKSYAVRVSVAEDDTHSYSVDIINDGKSAYYRANSQPTYEFVATLKDGTTYSQPLTHDKFSDPATFAAKSHCIITLSAGKVDAGLKVKVEQVAVEQVSISETIPVEWLPKPKVEAIGFDETNTLYVADGATVSREAKLKIALAKGFGLDDLSFSLNFGLVDALTGDYQLSILTQEQRQAIESKGVVLPAIGDKEPVIDLSAVTTSMKANADGSDATYVISDLVATANKRSSDSQTYSITASKFVYDFVVYPGHTWTKEFTATPQLTSGNADIFNKNIIYEYSNDGGASWLPASAGATVNGLEPGQSYSVRANCLGLLSEVKTVTTFPIIPLKNGGLENYSATKETLDYGTIYSWPGWATLNELTCDNSVKTACWYNSRSGTQPVVESGINAVWIATIGWGYGSTNYAIISGGDKGIIKFMTPGELFLGTTTNVDHSADTATKNYGIQFESRPSSLKFRYKYIPYDGDNSDISIQILCDDVILGDAFLKQNSEIGWTDIDLKIDYAKYEEHKGLVPNKLKLVFKSGEKKSVARNMKINDVLRVGSQLWINSVSLQYER